MSHLEAVFTAVDDGETAGTDRLVDVVRREVGCDAARARRLLSEARIARSATVRQVGRRQRPVITRCVEAAVARQ